MKARDSSPGEPETRGTPACAICGKPRDPRYDPFCSKRCADVDLHRWLTGRYVVTGGEPDDQATSRGSADG